MMNRESLEKTIAEKKSFLCVGLDVSQSLLPNPLKGRGADGVLQFATDIIAATSQHCVAYKVNTAFFEAMGPEGWELLLQLRRLIPATHLAIADAKRGDIGNTGQQYAQAFFDTLDYDAVTVAPYMGSDSVRPFLEHPGKWTIVLALTSNPGSSDFQLQPLASGQYLFERVLSECSGWGSASQIMFVVGATQPQWLQRVRAVVPGHFLLVPGVGAQGGTVASVASAGLVPGCGLLINASRQILFASAGEDYALAAAQQASLLQQQMAQALAS